VLLKNEIIMVDIVNGEMKVKFGEMKTSG